MRTTAANTIVAEDKTPEQPAYTSEEQQKKNI